MTPPLELLDLRPGMVEAGSHRRLGEILVERRALNSTALRSALARQPIAGRRLGEVVLAHGLADGAAVAGALAEQWGVIPADLERSPPEAALIDGDLSEAYLAHRILPWQRAGAGICYVTDRPEHALEALQAIGAGRAPVAVVPTRQLDLVLGASLGPGLALRAAERTPPEASVRVLGRARLFAVGVLFAALAVLLFGGVPGLAVALGVVLVLTSATTVLRLAALVAGAAPAEVRPAGNGAGAAAGVAAPGPVPVITLMVPLFREGVMVPRIIEALGALDYPEEALDVKLLLEAGDAETLAAVEAMDLPAWIQPLVVPPGAPQTKPRAMNFALDFARGEIVGIFDAEDRPDPDQLRQVAGYLATAPSDIGCVQCQLSYYNASENWITRCFQIEYSIWFEVLLSGFQRLGLPIPLGGTSVYFRREALERLGAWDAHNVTEDADLGMRLARNGLGCAVLSSTTGEEANCRIGPWIRQRSRWLKGYLMTWLSHMRDPVRLWRDVGLRGFLGLNVLFLGAAATYLAMPVFWAALLGGFVTGQPIWSAAVPGWALLPLGLALGAGQAVMLGCAALAMVRRGSPGLLIWVPTLPIYWSLGAIAAWKAVLELVLAPYYWDKTQHGISRVFRQAAEESSK